MLLKRELSTDLSETESENTTIHLIYSAFHHPLTELPLTSTTYLLFKVPVLRFGIVLGVFRVHQLPPQFLDFHLHLLSLELACLAALGTGGLLFRLLPVFAFVRHLGLQRLPVSSFLAQPSLDRLHALPFLLSLDRQVLESVMDRLTNLKYSMKNWIDLTCSVARRTPSVWPANMSSDCR